MTTVEIERNDISASVGESKRNAANGIEQALAYLLKDAVESQMVITAQAISLALRVVAYDLRS